MKHIIAVIGKSGQLAMELAELNKTAGGDFQSKLICYGRDDIDISDTTSIENILNRDNITAVINASAYTNVDLAESEKEIAGLVNHKAVENLAKICRELSLPLVHVSTDYVFSGEKGEPYLVDDLTNPQGVYGQTKAAGEKAILANHANQSTIIRTSWVYSLHGKNFVKTMLNLMEKREELSVIDDQVGAPTWAYTLAKVCVYTIENRVFGIYHWTDEGKTSWYNFALVIQKIGLEKNLLTKPCLIKPIPSSAYPSTAKRPDYSVLDISKNRIYFDGIDNHHWEVQLNNMLDQFKVTRS